MVGSKRGHSKSLALKTKDLYHRHFGDLKMDKVELRTFNRRVSNLSAAGFEAASRLNNGGYGARFSLKSPAQIVFGQVIKPLSLL